jgi:tetratricopeptide (TPR) repeat protein
LPALLFLWLRHDMLVTHVEPRGPFWVEHDANPLYYLPPLERIVNATCILVYGLAKVCLPCNMSSNYGDGPFTLIQSVFHWRFLGASLLLVALAVGGWRVRRRHPLLFLATAAGLGFSFITSNIPLPIETIFGDRLYYTAVLGLSFGTAWLAQRITLARQFTSTCRIAAVAVLVAWTGWNCVAGFERGRAWYDNMSLTKSDLRSQPDSVGLHVDMGNLHLWNFDPESGLLEFRRALALNPQSPRALRFLAENTKDEGDARRLLQRALASPLLVPATEGRRIHWALGNLHDKAGDPAAARAAYLEALACNPYVPDIRLHLLRDTANAGEWDLFTELLDEGRRLVPDYPPLELYHGVALHHAQAFDAAAAVFARVLPELPEQVHVVESWFRYADCLLHLGEAAGARAIALRFQRRAGKHPTLRAGCDELLQRTATARPPR